MVTPFLPLPLFGLLIPLLTLPDRMLLLMPYAGHQNLVNKLLGSI